MEKIRMKTIKYAILLLAIVLIHCPIIYAEDFKIGWSILAPGGELTTSTNSIKVVQLLNQLPGEVFRELSRLIPDIK
jgi:hypothetical protein